MRPRKLLTDLSLTMLMLIECISIFNLGCYGQKRKRKRRTKRKGKRRAHQPLIFSIPITQQDRSQVEGMSAVVYDYVHLSPKAEWLIVVGRYIHAETARQTLDGFHEGSVDVLGDEFTGFVTLCSQRTQEPEGEREREA
jgi:hypothetical protein